MISRRVITVVFNVLWFVVFNVSLPVSAHSSDYKIRIHKEHVHQYIVQEAYRFLEREVGEIPVLRSYVGLGFYGRGPDVNAWNRNEAIAIGAWREDLFDSQFNSLNLSSICTSVSHFWNADAGDNSLANVTFLCPSFPNAFVKSLNYLGGTSRNSNFVLTQDANRQYYWDGFWTSTVAARYRYTDLCNFMTTGNMTLQSVIDVRGREWQRNVSTQADNLVRMQWGFNILGRVLHLLGDMSVPAHTMLDPHPCDVGNPEYYELWMGSNEVGNCNEHHAAFTANNWTMSSVREQGGLMLEVFNMSDVDAIRYLYYNLNQLTNHFKSTDQMGNNNLPNGTTLTLIKRYNDLGEPPSTVNSQEIANETFKYCIRASATLMYWFSAKLGLVQCPNTRTFQSERFYGARNNNDLSVFRAQNSIVTGSNVRNDFPSGLFVIESPARLNMNASKSISMRVGTRISEGSIVRASILNQPCNQLTSNTCSFFIPSLAKNVAEPHTMSVVLDTVSRLQIYMEQDWFIDSTEGSFKYIHWSRYKEFTGSYVVRNDSNSPRPSDYALIADTIVVLDSSNNIIQTIDSRSLVSFNGDTVTIPNISESNINYRTNSLLIYPNPNIGEIEFSGLVVSDVEVLSLSGQIISKFSVQGQKVRLDGVSPGVYYLRCKTPNGCITNPLVLVK